MSTLELPASFSTRREVLLSAIAAARPMRELIGHLSARQWISVHDELFKLVHTIKRTEFDVRDVVVLK